MKAALYARVSKNSQTEENQLLELRAFAKARNYEIIEFIDHGISGAKDEWERPQLKRLLDAARHHRFDLVIAWDLSRVARSTQQLVGFMKNFQNWNVGFTTLRENIDTTTANGRLVFHIFAALAEFERELIKERIFAGLRRAKAEGKTFGRPRIIQDLERLQELRKAGKSFREMEIATGINRMTILRALSRNGFQKQPSLP